MYWDQNNGFENNSKMGNLNKKQLDLERRDVESATKYALEKLNIFSYNTAKNNRTQDYDIDLTCIYNNIISLPNATHKGPLIINIPK